MPSRSDRLSHLWAPLPPPRKGLPLPDGGSTGLGDSEGPPPPLSGLPLPSGEAIAPERLRLKGLPPLPPPPRAMLLCTFGLTVCSRSTLSSGSSW